MAVSVFINLIPSIIAFSRCHRKAKVILLVNILLGWTLVAWLICLAWAFVDQLPTDAAMLAAGKCPYCELPLKKGAVACRFCNKKIATV